MNNILIEMQQLSDKLNDGDLKINDRLSIIKKTKDLSFRGETILEEMTGKIDNYIPQANQVDDINSTMEQVEKEIETLDNLDLDQSFQLYKKIMDDIEGIDNFISQVSDSYVES